MPTDLMERTSTPTPETIVLPQATRKSPWPFIVGAAIILAAALTTGILVMTRTEPVGTFPELNTAVREGAGVAQIEAPGLFPSLNTATREGFSTIPVVTTGTTGLNTSVREGGTLYPEDFSDATGKGHVPPRGYPDPGEYFEYAGGVHRV
jgi:hypothetical protein